MSADVDLLVVGSGPVGATFARLVSDAHPGARIMMVDLGPQLTARPGENVRNLRDAEQRRRAELMSQGRALAPAVLAAAGAPGAVRARPGTHLARELESVDSDQDGMPAAALSSNVGGMGAHWTCACPAPGDGERIPFLDASAWSAAWATATRLLGVTTAGFAATSQGRAVLEALGRAFNPLLGDRRVGPMPLACRPTADGPPRWAGADTILGPVAAGDRDGFTLRAETLCRRLLIDGDRVRGAELEHLPTGDVTTVTARAVAVAADALRTPQLLWASGFRPPALGRYLNDQPQSVGAVQLDSDVIDTESANGRVEFLRDHLTGVSWVPYAEPDHPYHGQVMQLDASPVQLAGAGETGAVVGLGWFCRKQLRAEDRVELSDDETDAYGMPAMRIHYELSDADRDAIAGAIDQLRRAASALGDFLPDAGPRLLPAGSSLHYQGTVRMGRDDDGASVCDTRSRVWGVQNLFVGGNGVIPTATACNPTATSVALAALASEAIVRQLT
jgi:pyranose oxidase